MGSEKRNLLKEFIAFNIVGIINTVITYGIYSLLVFLGIDYKLALFGEYCFGVAFSFLANRKFTFKHTEKINLYMIVSMVSSYIFIFLLNMALLVVFVEKLFLGKYLAQLFALAISVAASFLAQKYVVFRKTGHFSIKNISIVLLIFVPVLLMFQGLDFTDTGWVLSSYQQIFNDPASVSYWFHLWLSNFIGGLWNIFFGWGGLLSFKIGAVIIFWITAFCVYKVYRTIISPDYLFPALAAGMIFQFPSRITVIHYNNVSMLFFTLGAALLFRGIRKKSPLFIFLSGGAVSLAAFSRISNILGMAFVLILVYAWVLEKETPKELFKVISSFFGGAITAIAAVILTMYILGHLNIYLKSVLELFSWKEHIYSNYSSKTMIKRFLIDWVAALFTAGLAILAFSFTQVTAKKISPRYGFNICLAAIFAIAAAFSWIYAWQKTSYITIPFAGMIVLSCALIAAFAGPKYKDHKILSLISIFLTVILSLGSDTGISVSAYSFIFGFPLLFWYCFEMPETRYTAAAYFGGVLTKEYSLGGKPGARKAVMLCVLVFFIGYSGPLLFRNVYRDNSLRWKMTKTVDHPLLRGVFTTSERAKAISELLTELQQNVKPDDFLLTYESIPMLCYITETRPFLYNSWPILYLPGEFEKSLGKAQRERPYLPIAVLAKVQIRSGTWPKSGKVHQGELQTITRSMLHTFLENNKYRKIWENNTFEIFAPP